MWILHIISFLLLSVGVADDLRSRKIHNQLILILLFISFFSSLLFYGLNFSFWTALKVILFSGLLSLGISIPLYLLKMIGGGDVKLYFAVSLMWDLGTTAQAFLYALPISLVFGLLRIVLKGQISQFFKNIYALIRLQKLKTENLETFPFSVALLLGWMSVVVLKTL